MGLTILVGIVGMLLGAFVAVLIKIAIDRSHEKTAKDRAKKILDDANHEANRVFEETKKDAEAFKREKELEARDDALALKQKQEDDFNRKYDELRQQEKKLRDREIGLDKRYDRIRQSEREHRDKERELRRAQKSIEGKEERLEILVQEKQAQLEKTAGMTRDEAIAILKEELLDKARRQTAEMVKDMRDKAKLEANREAREIIIQAIQRSAADHAAENTVSVVNLPNDDVKGRIIGREGRNIRALEAATGVDIIVDDTPEAVILSSFDPYRRERARIALEKLIQDGRIHPARIEEVVLKADKELEEKIIEFGQNALLEAKVHGVHPELVKYLGRMHYRTSYGQNVLKHSIEVSVLTGLMAIQLGLDAKLARRAGLLHDIGKSIDRDMEGTHVSIGLELAQKYNENKVVQNAITSHHEDTPFTHPISVLVQAADSISGSRPGARRETLEGYIQRMHGLEEIASSFDGVGKVYAIQAGREVRVIVENDKITDALADALAHDCAEKIENELEYPGQIKVTVIREYRAVDHAK
ncbi:ribonuclease Y [bacterium]|nr:ribonuclease Y [bacterium]